MKKILAAMGLAIVTMVLAYGLGTLLRPFVHTPEPVTVVAPTPVRVCGMLQFNTPERDGALVFTCTLRWPNGNFDIRHPGVPEYEGFSMFFEAGQPRQGEPDPLY